MSKVRRIIKNMLTSKQYRRHALVGAPNVWKMTREFQFQFILNHGLKQDHNFMDIGCGTLRGGIPVINYLNKGNYYGLEVRSHVLDEAKEELTKANLHSKKPNLILLKKFPELYIEARFEFIWAFSVLIHFEDEIAENCFQFIGKSLAKGGVFFANVNMGDFKDGNWVEFPVVFRSQDFYNNLAKNNGMDVDIMGNLFDLGYDSGKKSDKQQVMLKFTKL